MSHVTYERVMNESRHIWTSPEWVTSHMNESWMSHVTYERVMNESRHIWTSHEWHTDVFPKIMAPLHLNRPQTFPRRIYFALILIPPSKIYVTFERISSHTRDICHIWKNLITNAKCRVIWHDFLGHDFGVCDETFVGIMTRLLRMCRDCDVLARPRPSKHWKHDT